MIFQKICIQANSARENTRFLLIFYNSPLRVILLNGLTWTRTLTSHLRMKNSKQKQRFAEGHA